MNMQFSETQEMLRASAREFLTESCPSSFLREMRRDERGFSRELWKTMGELGWPGLAFPEEYGGSGMSFLDLCLLIEEMGRACLPSPFIGTVVGCGLLLLELGSEEQRNEFLPGLASGDLIVAPAFHGAPDSGGARVLPAVERDDGGFTLTGTHLFVPFLSAATYVLCAAHMADEAGGTSLFMMPASTANVVSTPLPGIGSERVFQLDLDGVRLPGAALVGAGSDMSESLKRTLLRLDVAQCCDAVGALGWVLDDTVAYAKDRKQFGHPIGSFQSIQHYCADMHVMLEGLRTSTYHAAWRLSEGMQADKEVAVACAYAHKVVPEVLGLAHQIHGAMGVTQEHDLYLYSTRAAAPAHGFAPTSGYLEAVLAA
jgi:alkylation response protein AidB-like acyl-CoA dehydrogenase